VFGAGKGIRLMAQQRRDMDAALRERGRDPEEVGIVWSTKVIVGETEADAKAMREQLIADVPEESGWGVAIAQHGDQQSDKPERPSSSRRRIAHSAPVPKNAAACRHVDAVLCDSHTPTASSGTIGDQLLAHRPFASASVSPDDDLGRPDDADFFRIAAAFPQRCIHIAPLLRHQADALAGPEHMVDKAGGGADAAGRAAGLDQYRVALRRRHDVSAAL